MATTTGPQEQANDKPVRRTDPPARPLWQAPVFVLGVAALLAMGLTRPFLPATPIEKITRELKEAQEILTHSDGDAERALKFARRALEAADQFPDLIGEAAFLVGTAHLCLAEKADSSRAPESWQRAHQYLEQAEKSLNVPDKDQPLLMYRQAKVGMYTGDDLQLVIKRLEEAVPRVDTRAEGYGLLTQAYLRLNPPDLKNALRSNKALREVPEVSESELSAAQLLGGELLLRLGQPEEARRSLEKITESAPAAILVRARLLRARSYQDQKMWGDAARLYVRALSDQREPIPEPAQIYYNLGLCYREMEQPQEAAKAWQKCVQLARGEEGQAAAIVLANLRLLEDNPTPAVEILTRAVAKVRTPADWTNKLIDVNKALATFEKAMQVFQAKELYQQAMQLLEPYGKLAEPFKVVVLRADLAAAWAAAKTEAVRSGKPDEDGLAHKLFVQAAESYAEAATAPGLAPTDQGGYLWRSAAAYQSAQEPVKAAEQFEKFVKLNVEPTRLGEAYYRLAEVYRNDQDETKAKAGYEKCMEYKTTFAYLARYQLAVGELKAGRIDEGEAHLAQNLEQLRFETNLEALGQTLFELGNLLYKRRDYRRVARHLETALGKFKDSPLFKDNAEVTQARYQLADSYRQLAAQENQDFLLNETMSADTRAQHQANHRRWLQMAADEFASLDAFLDTLAGKDHIPGQRIQVPLITAKCWFNLGKYEKALAVYERVIERFPEQVEGLDALGGAVSCHAAMGDIERVRSKLLRIRQLLPKMPADIRPAWEKWVDAAIKPLEDLEREGEKTGVSGSGSSGSPVGSGVQ